MKLRMIVLKEAKSASTDFVLASTKGNRSAKRQLALEFRETTANDRRDLRHEKGVVAAAVPMPVHLIKSFGASAMSGTKPPKVSWGVKAVNAEASDFTGAGVTVAVLDTGIDPDHPAFHGVELVRENFVGGPDEDVDGHGTHCAGTIFGRNVAGTRIGIARGVSKALICKVIGENGGSTENIVKAINWSLANGAKVISMSLGMDFAGYQKFLMEEHGLPAEQATSLALAGYRDNVRLFDKISSATSSKGVVFNSAIVSAAAGNESHHPDYAITVAPPAAAELFLSVAAIGLGSDGRPPYSIAPFSNEGATFAAPGVDIWSAQPGGGLVALSGTSMATPHVAGIAALWAEKSKDTFNAAQTIELMAAHAIKLEPHVRIGDARHGLIQAPLS